MVRWLLNASVGNITANCAVQGVAENVSIKAVTVTGAFVKACHLVLFMLRTSQFPVASRKLGLKTGLACQQCVAEDSVR